MFPRSRKGELQIQLQRVAARLLVGRYTTVPFAATGIVVGSYAVGTPSTTTLRVPDSSLSKAFFLAQTQNADNTTTVTLQSFALVNFTLLNLVRWGQNGLAFNTNQGQIVLLGSSFVN